MKIGKRLRRGLAWAGAALAGVILPTCVVVDQANAYVPPSAIKAVQILPKIAAGGAAAEEAGTALVPLRFLALDNPITGTIMIAGTAAWFWMNHTQSGQTVKKKLWDWIDSKNWTGYSPGVTAGNSCTFVPPDAVDFSAGDNSVTFPVGTLQKTANYWPAGDASACAQATDQVVTLCRYGVAGNGHPAGYVQAITAGGSTFTYTGTTPPSSQGPGAILDACPAGQGMGAVKPQVIEVLLRGTTSGTASGAAVKSESAVYHNPFAPAGSGASLASITATKTCIAGDGTTVSVSATSAVGDPTIPNVDCPAGSVPMKQNVKVNFIGGTGGSPLQSTDVGTTTIDQTQAAKYPQCLGAGSTGCAFWIEYNGDQCTVGMPGCATWWDVWQKDTARVVCHWGPYTMPTPADCQEIRHAYVTQFGAVTDPGADTDGLTRTTMPALDEQGTPWPVGDPYPGQEADPSTGTKTGTDPGTDPGTSTQPAPAPIPSGDDGSNCWPGGSAAFNPLEWVYMPVKCVMVWAFEPSPETVTQLETKATTNLTTVTAWNDAITGVAGAFSTGGGADCMGPPVALGFPFNKTIYPAQSCSGPAADLAAVSRAGSTAGLILAALFSSFYALAQGFGYTVKKFQTDSAAGKGK